MPSPSSSSDLASTFAFWVLRLWLGLRALLAGLEKYAGKVTEQQPLLDEFGEPDINGAMVEVSRKVYSFDHYHGLPAPLASRFAEEPLLPGWALGLFDTLLGPVLIAMGIALLIGLAPRVTLLVHGLIYTSLSVGLILIGQDGGIAWLGIHVLLVVAALRLVPHDRFAVLPKW